MQINRLVLNFLITGALAAVSGCVERRVTYVPVYQPPTVVVQATPQAAPPPPTAGPSQVVAAPVVISQPPPPRRPEVVPAPPGPYYVWQPGYWSWQGRWVWINGSYLMPPRPRAVWRPGYWAPHGRGYVWIGGHWR
jgi:hypothetical protein